MRQYAIGWRPMEHSDKDNAQWSMLRGLEWGIWPAFLSQPIVPLLLLSVDWWKVVGGFAILTIAWSVVRYRYVSVTAASLGVHIVLLKWLTCPMAVILLLLKHRYGLAGLALLWPLLTAYLGVLVGGTQVGRIQALFMNKLGYATAD